MKEDSRLLPSIDMLNDDILSRIFDYLHFDDKIRLRRTCYRWKLLLDYQLNRVKALRIGHFYQGGYHVTSGLQLAHCEHSRSSRNHRQHTGSLLNEQVLVIPADFETQCFSINHYDYLHRALKLCHQSITMLSLGRINITYRLLMVLTHNLPKLEHLELIGCASGLEQWESAKRKHKPNNQANNDTSITRETTVGDDNEDVPTIESFNSVGERRRHQADALYRTMVLYNQNQDEQTNMEGRLIRSSFVKSCELVRESKANNCWPNLRHLLVKDCSLLHEFSLILILAISNQTLTHLVIESNQYLTGEFLNYCGPKLKLLRLRYCPLLKLKFLEDLVKLKQLLSPSDQTTCATTNNAVADHHTRQHHRIISPKPIDASMFRNFNKNFKTQDIYCML